VAEDLAMMTLAAFLIFGAVCFIAGRHYQLSIHRHDLRRLGRHIDRQVAEHREHVSRIPR